MDDDSCDAPDHGNHVLQVVFDPQIQANRRRKSSMVDRHHVPSTSSCYVHALLETQRAAARKETTIPSTIAEEKSVKEQKLSDCGAFAEMTKSQLNDMVLGVRELSKHLANLCIKMHPRSIFILTKPYDSSMVLYTRTLTEWLLERGFTVFVEAKLEASVEFDAEHLPCDKGKLRYWTLDNRPQAVDFVITLGGDGTVLYASWLFQKVVPPILSFSLGSLGFLTKFDFDQFDTTLARIFKEGVTVGLRLRFEGTIMRAIDRPGVVREQRSLGDEILSPEDLETHQRGESFVVLNEVVVDRGPNPTLSTTELYGDDMFLTQIAADGICVATPTGSTAYSLAAGGSLCHPELPAMLVSVICAHSLTFRPLILPDSMVLRIGVPYNARTTAWVSFDGRQRTELHQGDYVSVIASRFPFPVVQNKSDNKDWFDSIRRTMNWGIRTPQKPFEQGKI